MISRTVISSMQRACTHKVPGFNTDYSVRHHALPYCTHSTSEHYTALHILLPLALAICGHSNDIGRLANFPTDGKQRVRVVRPDVYCVQCTPEQGGEIWLSSRQWLTMGDYGSDFTVCKVQRSGDMAQLPHPSLQWVRFR